MTINDCCEYPMMSVFKLHQAVAVCDRWARAGYSLDSVLSIRRDELNPDTWSPMLKEHQDSLITLSVKDLIDYALTLSDNNASNYMFRHMVPVEETDSLVATVIPRSSFSIKYTEDEMAISHQRAYENRTSPSGAAMLLDRLYGEGIIYFESQEFIKETLERCQTGKDRIIAPLLDIEGIKVAHKTGSGYINEKGELVAHNDVAHVMLPDGNNYTLAVFVKNFKGTVTEASSLIAEISATVYSFLMYWI